MADPIVTGAGKAINGTAARVVAKAKESTLWRPMPALHAGHRLSATPLAVAPIPPLAPSELRAIPGRRRGRITVIGYAQDQGSKKGSAKWVVRCDCGNYDTRTNIIRWLSIQADDMCPECRKRQYLLAQGRQPSLPKAKRVSVDLGGEHG